jgi:hypothetical protein
MRPAWYERTGAASDVLTVGELPQPAAGRGEVLVRITDGVVARAMGARANASDPAEKRPTAAISNALKTCGANREKPL